MQSETMTPEQVLDAKVLELVKDGYVPKMRSAHTALLVKYRTIRDNASLYLSVDPEGNIQSVKGKLPPLN